MLGPRTMAACLSCCCLSHCIGVCYRPARLCSHPSADVDELLSDVVHADRQLCLQLLHLLQRHWGLPRRGWRAVLAMYCALPLTVLF